MIPAPRARRLAWCLRLPAAMPALLHAAQHVDGFPAALAAYANIVPVLLALLLAGAPDLGIRAPDIAAGTVSVYAFWAPAVYVAHAALGACVTCRLHAARGALWRNRAPLAWCAGTPLACWAAPALRAPPPPGRHSTRRGPASSRLPSMAPCMAGRISCPLQAARGRCCRRPPPLPRSGPPWHIALWTCGRCRGAAALPWCGPGPAPPRPAAPCRPRPSTGLPVRAGPCGGIRLRAAGPAPPGRGIPRAGPPRSP